MPSIITLAGADTKKWQLFENYLEGKKGSIGISYGLTINPCDLYNDLGRNDALFIHNLTNHLHNNKYGKPLSAMAAKLVLTFVKFSLGETKTFVIRRARTAIYLAQRTSEVLLDTNAYYSIRIKYEIIGPSPVEIQAALNVSPEAQAVIPPAVIIVHY
jgi:hypothetical protein